MNLVETIFTTSDGVVMDDQNIAYDDLDFPTNDIESEIENPMGGEEGITIYDRLNLDPDFVGVENLK